MRESSEIKHKVITGMLWKVLENAVQLVISLMLARMILPKEYGVIILLTTFIAFANVFIQSGFQTALIQKKKTDSLDISSVCFLTLAIAAVFYLLLFVLAPVIADFYGNRQLSFMLRVLALVLFSGAVISTQSAAASRAMEFKKLCMGSLFSALGSGAIGVVAAMHGAGAWALVFQQLVQSFLLMLFLWIALPWKIGYGFSWTRIRGLFFYGWKLTCAAVLDTLYQNLYTLIIGKRYEPGVLGSYSRGNQFPQLIVSNLGASIQSVMLPALSSSQEHPERIKVMMRRAIGTSTFCVFPVMAGLAVTAKPLITIVLTEKWISCVPFLQLMCAAYAVWPMHIANLQAVNALGRSDVFLRLEVVKKILGISVFFISLPFGIMAMVWGKVVVDFLCTAVNGYPVKKMLGYGAWEQWKDVFPSLVLSVVMAVVVWSIGLFVHSPVLLLCLQVMAGIVFYTAAAWILGLESFLYLKETLTGVIKGRT